MEGAVVIPNTSQGNFQNEIEKATLPSPRYHLNLKAHDFLPNYGLIQILPTVFSLKKYKYSIPKDTMTIGIENRFKSHVPLALGRRPIYVQSVFVSTTFDLHTKTGFGCQTHHIR